jgi:hypothetical protein
MVGKFSLHLSPDGKQFTNLTKIETYYMHNDRWERTSDGDPGYFIPDPDPGIFSSQIRILRPT